MKKTTFILACVGIINTASAQTLCVVDAGCTSPVTIQVDDCTLSAIRNLNFSSQKQAYDYRRTTNNQWGNYHWDIRAVLKNVTTNQDLEIIQLNVPIGGTEEIIYNALEQAAGASQGKFSFSRYGDRKLRFNFQSKILRKDHVYGVNLRITNYSLIGPIRFDETLQTDESHQILINGNTEYTPNAWNRRVIDANTPIAPGKISSTTNGQGFTVDINNRPVNIVWSNNKWNIWSLDWNFTTAAAGATATNPNNGNVFFIGSDGRIYRAYYANNQWNISNIVPSFTNAAPGAITVNPNNGEVYFIGKDDRIYNAKYSNNQWNVWAVNWSFTNAAPGAITVNPNNGEVYFIGKDSRLYNAKYVNNQWVTSAMNWSFTNAASGAIAVNPSNWEVYFIGKDGRPHNAKYTNNQWNVWTLDWNFTSAAPGAITVGSNDGGVYFVGNNGNIYKALYAGSQWTISNLGYVSGQSASPGTIGTIRKVIGNQTHDVVVSRSNYGNLVTHSWVTCPLLKEAPPTIDSLIIDMSQELVSNSLETNSLKPNFISIYPNPTTNQFIIECELPQSANTSVALYSMNGSIIRNIITDQHLAGGHHKIDVTTIGLPVGVYYVYIDVSGQREIKKILIQ